VSSYGNLKPLVIAFSLLEKFRVPLLYLIILFSLGPGIIMFMRLIKKKDFATGTNPSLKDGV